MLPGREHERRVIGHWPEQKVVLVAFEPVALRYNPGRVWSSFPVVFATAYGPNAVQRAIFTYTLMKTRGYGWKDRTGDLRASVKRIAPGVVSYGNQSAPYAVFVEAWGGAMRRAYSLALKQFGFGGEQVAA